MKKHQKFNYEIVIYKGVYFMLDYICLPYIVYSLNSIRIIFYLVFEPNWHFDMLEIKLCISNI